MKTINELQDEVIEEFSDFDDWMDKYQLLIDLGNEQEPLDPKYKTEQNLIDGCQSRVWLQADYIDGNVVFQAESDALIVKGIIALLIKVVSGHTPDEILNSDLYFIEKIGLKEHLSPTRSNGLLAMVKQIRMYALAFKAKQGQNDNRCCFRLSEKQQRFLFALYDKKAYYLSSVYTAEGCSTCQLIFNGLFCIRHTMGKPSLSNIHISPPSFWSTQ